MKNHAIILTLLFVLLLKANDHSQYFRIGKKIQRSESSCGQPSSKSLILRLQYSANAAFQIRLAGSANAWIKKSFGNNLLQALKAAFLQGFKNSGGQARPLNLAIVQTKGIYILVYITFWLHRTKRFRRTRKSHSIFFVINPRFYSLFHTIEC